MRSLLLALVFIGGCAADTEEEPRSIRSLIDVNGIKLESFQEQDDGVDVCALARELDSDNVCSLMCDPDAMADFLLAHGTTGGKCVQLRCELPGIAPVFVGVCLAP